LLRTERALREAERLLAGQQLGFSLVVELAIGVFHVGLCRPPPRPSRIERHRGKRAFRMLERRGRRRRLPLPAAATLSTAPSLLCARQGHQRQCHEDDADKQRSLHMTSSDVFSSLGRREYGAEREKGKV